MYSWFPCNLVSAEPERAGRPAARITQRGAVTRSPRPGRARARGWTRVRHAPPQPFYFRLRDLDLKPHTPAHCGDKVRDRRLNVLSEGWNE
ncbi:hypothetical protein EVAR_19469_1 [Eumeta japonica]|uniref:Uncharacterized protein n=1 Tax=Eumeta variegata TaxID=151549 RepID=A0A4C1V992_EUMVA|nr:hypothetical protein EVAR_19469_1 [Eumeta japonica]